MQTISEFYTHIAREYSTPEAIQAAVQAKIQRTRHATDREFMAPRTPLEDQVTRIWAEVLHLDRVGIYDDFFAIGGNSLLAAQLIARLRQHFPVDLPLRSLLETPTIAELTQTLLMKFQGVSSDDGQAPLQLDLRAEIVLDEAIRPVGTSTPQASDPTAVFLTGSTGFLGTFLLYELLQQTSATIFCLIRATNIEAGHARIRSVLTEYAIWNDQFASRIVPILGDLALPLLGLSFQQFDDLAGRVQSIYHSGASVNFIYPYSSLKAANVQGTQEVLRLACTGTTKPVHYMSTLSVFHSDGYQEKKNFFEHDEPEFYTGFPNSYDQTKWVAEHIVRLAHARGVSVTVYRPGQIMGHSQTGVFNQADLFYNFLKGCIQLGQIPESEAPMIITPIDYVSQAIIHISRHQPCIGQSFHLINPSSMEWNDMIDWLHSKGYTLQQCSYDQWVTALLNRHLHQEHALAPFLSMFLDTQVTPQHIEHQHYDCRHTLAALKETSIVCPPSDTTLLDIYYARFLESGFLALPSQESSAV